VLLIFLQALTGLLKGLGIDRVNLNEIEIT